MAISVNMPPAQEVTTLPADAESLEQIQSRQLSRAEMAKHRDPVPQVSDNNSAFCKRWRRHAATKMDAESKRRSSLDREGECKSEPDKSTKSIWPPLTRWDLGGSRASGEDQRAKSPASEDVNPPSKPEGTSTHQDHPSTSGGEPFSSAGAGEDDWGDQSDRLSARSDTGTHGSPEVSDLDEAETSPADGERARC